MNSTRIYGCSAQWKVAMFPKTCEQVETKLISKEHLVQYLACLDLQGSATSTMWSTSKPQFLGRVWKWRMIGCYSDGTDDLCQWCYKNYQNSQTIPWIFKTWNATIVPCKASSIWGKERASSWQPVCTCAWFTSMHIFTFIYKTKPTSLII